MNLKKRIENLKSQHLDDEEKIIRAMVVYRENFCLSYDEFINEPIPSFVSTLDQLNKMNKKRSRT